MAYDHEEQQQIDAIKAWWNQYGGLVTWTLIAVLAVFIAWKAWGIYQTKQSTQASVLFEELQKAIQDKDQPKILRAATDIQEQYAGTDYAQMASMLAAKNAFELNDLTQAKKQLTWVEQHGKTAEFKALAKLRLASILLDEKAYDDALKLLSGEFPAQLAGSVADRKGDILVAQNKIEEARASYQLALDKGTIGSPDRQYIQLKLDSIGGAPLNVVAK
jgi:predicted negative regulator of RcsB-dependent stress response